ncbi:hypothetical protein KBA41_18130 [Candidatus Ozemobacteraceae bacterium]|nr:hypothetical protein [Candidatus Ozemobacteraceae bacterium]
MKTESGDAGDERAVLCYHECELPMGGYSMNIWRRTTLMILVLSIALMGGAISPAAAREEKTGMAGVMQRLPATADAVLVKTAVVIQNRMKVFAEHLNAGNHVRLNISHGFYDRNLRRLFIMFDGAATFTGKLPFPEDLSDRYFTSDSDIAWDLTLFSIKRSGGKIGFRFQGDIVVFLDRLVYDLAKEFIDIAGGVAFAKAAEAMFDFASAFNTRLVAQAVTKTFASFSKESLSTTGAELVANAVQHDSHRVRDLVREAIANGSFADFCCVAIIRAGIDQTGGLVGATLGAMAGSAIAPGVGSAVGAFIGRRITISIAKNISYKLTVEGPMEVCLRQIRKEWRRLKERADDQVAAGRIASREKFIMGRLKREFDENRYETLDKLIERIGKFDAADLPAFVSLLSQVREMLTFKLLQKGDWYASKKLLQMKAALQKLGIAESAGF